MTGAQAASTRPPPGDHGVRGSRSALLRRHRRGRCAGKC